jgi:hypothetical protein
MARSIVEVALVVWAAGVKAPGGLEARWSGSQPPPTDRGPAYVTEQGGRQRVRSRKVSSNDCPSGSTTGRLPCTQSRRISQAKQAACRVPFPRHGEPRVAGRLRCLRHTRRELANSKTRGSAWARAARANHPRHDLRQFDSRTPIENHSQEYSQGQP